MDSIKQFLAKYSITGHSIAVLGTFLIWAFFTSPQFHDQVIGVYGLLPAAVKSLIATAVLLITLYRSWRAKGQPSPPFDYTRVRTFAALLLIPAVLLSSTVCLTGCMSQSSIAALVTTLGNAAAAIAGFEGNSQLATQLKADTAAASAAVLHWKKGSPAQAVLQALAIVEDDLNLIPYVAPYSALIDIALATAQAIITEIAGGQPPPAVNAKAAHRHVALAGKVPRNEKQFRVAWNKVASSDPRLAALEIK